MITTNTVADKNIITFTDSHHSYCWKLHESRNPQQESTHASLIPYCACLRLRRFDIENPLQNWINCAEENPQPVLGLFGSVKSAGMLWKLFSLKNFSLRGPCNTRSKQLPANQLICRVKQQVLCFAVLRDVTVSPLSTNL